MNPEQSDSTPPPQPPADAATANDAPRLRTESDSSRILQESFSQYTPPDNKEVYEDPVNSSPIVRMANAIITLAIEKEASDFQLDSAQRNFSVRARIDGRLRQVLVVPPHVRLHLFNRFKMMADIPFWKPAPQSGSIPLLHNGSSYNIAVQTTPTTYGELMTARVRTAQPMLGLRKLNVSAEVQVALEERILDGGLFLIVGPSGSGKTTFAYNFLNRLNDIEYTVATLEDGMTYHLSGLVQTYRSQRASARTLADSLVKQSVKALFCGNVTDADMLSAAVASAEAGVITFASITAPSVIGAVSQLVRLGEGGTRLGSVLSGVVVQTLAGTICPDCRQEVPWDETLRRRLERLHAGGFWSPHHAQPPDVIYQGAGCETCRNTGIRGQTGLYDFGEINPEVRTLMQPGTLVQLARSDWGRYMAHMLLAPTYAAVWGGKVSLDEAEHVVRPLIASARRLL